MRIGEYWQETRDDAGRGAGQEGRVSLDLLLEAVLSVEWEHGDERHLRAAGVLPLTLRALHDLHGTAPAASSMPAQDAMMRRVDAEYEGADRRDVDLAVGDQAVGGRLWQLAWRLMASREVGPHRPPHCTNRLPCRHHGCVPRVQ